MTDFCGVSTSLSPDQIALPTVVIGGLIDGLNPCAIGMLLLLLGYLIVFAQRKERVLKTGIVYITTVFLTYAAIGFLFYNTIVRFMVHPFFGSFSQVLTVSIGTFLILTGLVNIKDFLWIGKGLSLEIPKKIRPRLQKLVEKASLPATALLAILVTVFETPCSFPIYAGALSIVSRVSFCNWHKVGYLALYNFLFVLPLIFLLLLVYKGAEFVSLKEWEHRAKRWLRLVMGVSLLILGALVIRS